MSDPLSDRELIIYLAVGIPPTDILDYYMSVRKNWSTELIAAIRDVSEDEVKDGIANVELTVQDMATELP